MMKNLRIYLNLVEGSTLPIDAESGRELTEAILGDDVRPPPSVMVIEADAVDGQRVTLRVPYDERSLAQVSVQRGADG